MATTELARSPRQGALLVKAAIGALPLPGRARRATELPDTELVLRDVDVDPDHLAAYSRVCGFGVRNEVPPTYPHVLAAPLALRLLSDGTFPFPVIGLVHVGNAITQSRPLGMSEPLTLRVHAADLRPHERGVQFDVIHEASAGGEAVWRSVSTYLRRSSSGGSGRSGGGSSRSSGSGGRDGAPKDASAADVPTAVWTVPDNIGRRYAAVSGDRNPIHLHPLTARAFGFPRAIAHGMWTKARCLAALENRLPAAYTVDVAFKLPVLLPAKVAFHAGSTGSGGWRFGLRDARADRPHLTGTVTGR